MTEFNRRIEQQLELISEFWANPSFASQRWRENEPLQSEYYNHLKSSGFIEGDAARKAKDAREKTSGLVALGLLDDERKLTQAGRKLLQTLAAVDFTKDNLLQIPAGSFIYLKQLLKACVPMNGGYVRPYIVLAMALNMFGALSFNEFTYLLPLAVSKSKTDKVFSCIESIRGGKGSIDAAITGILMEMPNYREALGILLSNEVTEDVIVEIGMNRKSRNYDKPLFKLYQALEAVNVSRSGEDAMKLFDAVQAINGNSRKLWKRHLFNTATEKKIRRSGFVAVNADAKIFNCAGEQDFKTEFFRLLHLFKAKSTLSDYFDLNRRYFRTTDTVLFLESEVKFDILPSCFFKAADTALEAIAFSPDVNLNNDIPLEAILGVRVTESDLFAKAEELYGVHVRSLFDAQALVEKERYERLNAMIDSKFTDEYIVELMTAFEQKRYKEVQSMVTDNADAPTIFEYVLAIAWYKISERKGKVLDYMNLSLDADLLPVTHATGGHEDITYKYKASADYPAHTLLIEATLASATNQRRMEMEPVSRRLGEYLLAYPESRAYCIFATPYLHINVVSDFRMRKSAPYYSPDGNRSIDGMKIIPLQTRELAAIIKDKLNYAALYRIFDAAYASTTPPNLWYNQEVASRL